MKAFKTKFNQHQQGIIQSAQIFDLALDNKYTPKLSDESLTILKDSISEVGKHSSSQLVLQQQSQDETASILNHVMKTLAKNTIQRQLCVIDCAHLAKKYIGETEKNLMRMIAQAESNNWVLLFDEADALFGKRNGVSDAHQKYANQEVSYLLKQLTQHKVLTFIALQSPSLIASFKRLKVPVLN